MTTADTNDTYPTQLRELLDRRMASRQDLVAEAARVHKSRAALEAQDHAYSLAYGEALAAGWTQTERQRVFKSVGVGAPARVRRPKGRVCATVTAARAHGSHSGACTPNHAATS